MSFSSVFWYWLVGLMALFLPVELIAAAQHKGGTFSEFVWWAFAIKPRPDGKPVRYIAERHIVLTGMCIALWVHFRFATSVVPVAGFGALVGVVFIRAMFWERNAPDAGKVTGMGNLLAKLATPMLLKLVKGNWGKILPLALKAAAEGQLGATVAKVYWFMAGKKTITGAILIGLGTAAEAICASYPDMSWACPVSRYAFIAGTILTGVGLADGGTRSPWPAGTPQDWPTQPTSAPSPSAPADARGKILTR